MSGSSTFQFPSRVDSDATAPRTSFSGDTNGAPPEQGQAGAQPRRRRGASTQSNSAPYGRDYRKFILEHAERDPKRNFYFGNHFGGLSNMLLNTPDFPPPQDGEDFPYVVVREYGATASEPQIFRAATDHEKFYSLRDPPDGAAQIVFVRGYPSPKWILALGQRLKLDIDFFRQHLNFLEESDHYSEPPWPSLSANFLRLRLPTIIQRQSGLLREEVVAMRGQEYRGIRDYQSKLRRPGESILRRMCIHDELTLTVEQEMMISVIKRSNGWTAIVWLDHGKLLPFDAAAPWQNSAAQRRKAAADTHVDCVPLVQHLPPKFLGKIPEISPRDAGDPTGQASHGAFFLPFACGATLKPELARADAFYALSEVLRFAVASQLQLLNFLARAAHDTAAAAAARGDAVAALADLDYTRRLAADAAVHLDDLAAFLAQPPERFWGREPSPAGADARALLERDVACAQRRARAVAASTADGVAFVTNDIMLRRSQLGIAQASVMHRLTLLACAFLPLSFTVSFFGVNVREFGSGEISIWVVIVTFVPITLLVLLVCFSTAALGVARGAWRRWGLPVYLPVWRFWTRLCNGIW